MKKILNNRSLIKNIITYLVVTVTFLILSSMQSAGTLSRFMNKQLVPICVYISLAVSLNLLVGVCGELSLGHAGFMGVGAYTGMIVVSLISVSVPDPTVRMLIAMAAAALVAGCVGFLVGIPALRLRGDSLAIVTLAFGEILRNLLQNLHVGNADGVVRFAFSETAPEWKNNIVAGAMGTKLAYENKIATFTMGFVLVLITLFVVLNVINSKEGRAIKAVRDNRIAAESVGINVTAFRMKAFVISAALAGMAGALYGLDMTNLRPEKLGYDESINILLYVVLGGLGNVLGSVIAATALYILPEIMKNAALQDAGGWQQAFAEFLDEYRMLLYAGILIILMICTWSPKVKSAISQRTDTLKAWIKGLFSKKKEVTDHEG